MNRAILLLAALAACTGGETATTPEPEIVADPATDEAANIAAIALEIRAAPSDAATILASHGTTMAAFEASLYKIAKDPALSARYVAETAR